jgi:heptosyltransferase-1
VKVLIVKASALGDVVHALPVLPYLKSVNAVLDIDWVVEEPYAPLLSNNPMIRRLHVLRTKAWRQNVLTAEAQKGFLKLLNDVRKERYDVVLDLQGNSKSGMITFSTGAPLRYGFDRSGVREWPNLLTTNRKISITNDDYHIMDRTLLIPAAAFPDGAPPAHAGPLFVEKGLRDKVQNRLFEEGLEGKRIALFHCGASWETKQWGVESWIELARRVTEQLGMNVVLTRGSAAELTTCHTIRDASGGKAVIWPKSSIQEIAALLQSAAVVVGGDTGVIHMAAAVQTPTVSIFTATHGLRNGPRGERHRCLQSPLQCSPCLKRECPKKSDCGRSIGVDDVMRAIHSVTAPSETI